MPSAHALQAKAITDCSVSSVIVSTCIVGLMMTFIYRSGYGLQIKGMLSLVLIGSSLTLLGSLLTLLTKDTSTNPYVKVDRYASLSALIYALVYFTFIVRCFSIAKLFYRMQDVLRNDDQLFNTEYEWLSKQNKLQIQLALVLILFAIALWYLALSLDINPIPIAYITASSLNLITSLLLFQTAQFTGLFRGQIISNYLSTCVFYMMSIVCMLITVLQVCMIVLQIVENDTIYKITWQPSTFYFVVSYSLISLNALQILSILALYLRNARNSRRLRANLR